MGEAELGKEEIDAKATVASVAWPLLCAWRFSGEEALEPATGNGCLEEGPLVRQGSPPGTGGYGRALAASSRQ